MCAYVPMLQRGRQLRGHADDQGHGVPQRHGGVAAAGRL